MKKRIKTVMASVLGINESEITGETSPDNVSKWDSFSHMNLILALEEEFNVEVEDDILPNLISFEKIACYLEKIVSK